MANKGTILIVEDNQMNLEMAIELLQEAGFQTLEADEADTSIELAKQKQPDLILMDLYMPGKNGYDACKVLKSDPITREIPILAFTALVRDEEKKKAIDCGCAGIINKPINVDQFAKTVESYLPQVSVG